MITFKLMLQLIILNHICTQAAEKIYEGIGDPAKIEININSNNSTLYWLPKELILFDNFQNKKKD